MSQKKIQGNLNLIGGNLLIDGAPLSFTNFDAIRFKFEANTNYTIDDDNIFASYVRVVGQVMVLVASFYITKDTIGTGSNPITIGSFKNIPNDLWDKLVAGSSGYLDEQDTQAFVDGTFTSVGSKTALVKNTNDQSLDLILETTNMSNDVQYHVRYEAVLLLTNNITLFPNIKVENLGSSDPLNVVFSGGVDFVPRYEEVTIDGNVFIKFPTYYKKTYYNNREVIGFEMALRKIDDDYVPYDCFLDEQGNVLPYILVGKYCMSNSDVANSVNETPITKSFTNARTQARALGTGYQLMDIAIYCFVRDLIFMINESFSPSNYCGIEHLTQKTLLDGYFIQVQSWWGSGWVNASFISNKPSEYNNNRTNYVSAEIEIPPLAENNSGIKALCCASKTLYPTITIPMTAGGTTSTYYCSYYKTGVTAGYYAPRISFGGSSGLFYFDCSSTSNGYFRLCYRPVSQ